MKRPAFSFPALSLPVLANGALLLCLLLLAILFFRLQNPAVIWTVPAAGRSQMAALALLAYGIFCGLLFFRHHQHAKRREVAAAEFMVSSGSAKPWLVAYASQTGFAEHLAWQTALALQNAGVPVRFLPLAKVDASVLADSTRAFFIVSTTGEGDAPDSALRFVRQLMSRHVALPHLRYGLLALGDRRYTSFCAFAYALEAWLRHQGAGTLFDLVAVDNGDAGALRHWQHHLALLTGNAEMPDWSVPGYDRWTLVERRCLNPDSPGGPVFLVAFAALADMPTWQAGDIAEIGPCNGAADIEALLKNLTLDGATRVISEGMEKSLHEALSRRVLPHDMASLSALQRLAPQACVDALKVLPHREYSIASMPQDGRLEVLLRQMRQPDGRLGLGSAWLTENAAVGGEIALRIRENRIFHPPLDARPLILIANGTGLAGLRAHLKVRAAANQPRNWLLFGERSAAHDFFWREELEGWQKSGVLERLDLAFSRDQNERIYVQHKLRAASAELREWVAAGAAIYICGSLKGMAPAVAEVLAEALGEQQLEAMAEDGRYRRDVY